MKEQGNSPWPSWLTLGDVHQCSFCKTTYSYTYIFLGVLHFFYFASSALLYHFWYSSTKSQSHSLFTHLPYATFRPHILSVFPVSKTAPQMFLSTFLTVIYWMFDSRSKDRHEGEMNFQLPVEERSTAELLPGDIAEEKVLLWQHAVHAVFFSIFSARRLSVKHTWDGKK